MPELTPYPDETPEDFAARQRARGLAAVLMPGGSPYSALDSAAQGVVDRSLDPQNPVLSGASILAGGLLGGAQGMAGELAPQGHEALKKYLMAQTAPKPAPAGPAGVDPSTLSFADVAAQQQPAGQPQRGAMGLGLNLPSGVSTKGLRGVTQRLGDLAGQSEVVANEAMTNIGRAADATGRAIENQAQTEAAASEAVSKIQEQGLKEAAGIRDAYKERLEKAEARVNDSLAKWDDARTKFQAAEVNPDRKFSGGRKVGAAIAMAMGAFGAALTGGRNTAMDIIQSEINRDIAAQENAIARKKTGVDMAHTEVGLARQIFGDTNAARAAAEIAHWDNVVRKITAEQEKYKAPAALAKGEQMKAQIGMRVAELDNTIKTGAMSAERDALSKELQGETAIAGVSAGNQARQMQKSAMLSAAKTVNAPPPGLYIRDQNFRPDPKMTAKSQDIASAYDAARGAINEVIKWRSKFGFEALNQEEVASGEILIKRAMKMILKADKAGANVSEIEKEMTGIDYGASDLGYVMKKLTTVQGSLMQTTDDSLKAYGYGLKGRASQSKGTKI